MRREKKAWGWGCLALFVGFVLGGAVTFLALLGWTLIRPVERDLIENRITPGGYDLEVRLSESFLNRAVADELAKRKIEEITSITLDIQPENLMVATLGGPLELGGLESLPSVTADVRLGAENGDLQVHIEAVRVGPVQVSRDGLPELVQPVFETVESTVTAALNERLEAGSLAVLGIRTDENSITMGVVTVEQY
jgi:hypothetical protein